MIVVYDYLPDTYGSLATITFPAGNPSSIPPTAFSNLGSNKDHYHTIGFYYKASISSNFTFTLTSTNGSIHYYYTVAPNEAIGNTNFNVNDEYISKTNLIDVSGNIIPWTKILSEEIVNLISVLANYYVSIIFSKSGHGDGLINAGAHVCFASKTMILMSNYTFKQICDIKRYDEVISDIETKSTSIVSRNVCTVIDTNNAYKIPMGLLGNSNDIIGLGVHPIWCKEDKERILLKNIDGVIKINCIDSFHTLQFDHEGTYYVEGIKVDSLSPYHKKLPLGKENFIDKNLFVPNLIIKNENDKSRIKPNLNLKKVNPCEINYIKLII